MMGNMYQTQKEFPVFLKYVYYILQLFKPGFIKSPSKKIMMR